MMMKVLIGVGVLIVAVALMQGPSTQTDTAAPTAVAQVEPVETTVTRVTTVPIDPYHLPDQEIAILAVQLALVGEGYDPIDEEHLIEELILLHCEGIAERNGSVNLWALHLTTIISSEHEAAIAGATLAVAGYWCPEYEAAIERFIDD